MLRGKSESLNTKYYISYLWVAEFGVILILTNF